LAKGAEPTDVSKMNCWEMLMFAAFKSGMAKEKTLRTIYEDAAKQSGMAVPASIEKALCRGSKRIFDPKDPNSPQPLPGDIVIFDEIATHVAISLGKNDVLSNWDPPNFTSNVQKTTIEKLAAHSGAKTIKFCTAAW
jgi:cell wall-associated NlpC family hydrolase